MTAITGYKPYPPVTNAYLGWVTKNLPTLEALANRPVPTKPAHIKALGLILMEFLALYVRSGNDERNFKSSSQRLAIVSDALIADLAEYPLWATREGLAAYRKTVGGRFAPKVSGELLPHIQAAYWKAKRAVDCGKRIIRSNDMGNNLDTLRGSLDGLAGKELAYKALEVMNRLEKITDLGRDDAARVLHSKCYRIFHDWRTANPLPKLENNHVEN